MQPQSANSLLIISQIVVPLLTIAFSGLVSAYIAHRLAATRGDREFRLKRLEELFLASDKFFMHYVVQIMPYMPVMQGRLPFAKAKELIDKHSDKQGSEQLRTMEMLVKIYFPRLRDAYDKLVHHRDFIGTRFLSPFLTRVHKGDTCPDLFEGFSTAIQEIRKANEELAEAIWQEAERTRGNRIRRTLRKLTS
jgi:hypothetical protein